MNPTFTYAQVFHMLNEPKKYEGKHVRIRGLLYVRTFMEEDEERQACSCIIQDATACCSQGIAFEPLDANFDDDNFPQRGEEIIVSGIFHTYKEKKQTRVVLTKACFE